MVSVCAGIWFVPLAVNPLMGDMVEAVQVKVVPKTVAVRLTRVLVDPEHIVWSSGKFETEGLGLIITSWVTVFPAHPLNEEVML